MGTNYYHRSNICECCGRYDEHHICKSLTTFAAVIRHDETGDFDDEVLVGSWQEWKQRLLTDGEVWDEYGKQVPVGEFISRVEATDLNARRREFRWVATRQGEGRWLDKEGFSFYGGDFS